MSKFKFSERKYTKATTVIAKTLIHIAREDAEDATAWRPDFNEVLEDYTGDFVEQLKEEIHRRL